MSINKLELKEFDANKLDFFNKYKNIPKHILFALLLNNAIISNSTKTIHEILTIIENNFFQHIHLIFTFNDHTGFNVLTNLLVSGNIDLLNTFIDFVKKINYPIKKINCSDLDLLHLDTFLRCLQFNKENITADYFIDNLVKIFYTEESIENIQLK